MIGLIGGKAHEESEIVYTMHCDYRNKGYMTGFKRLRWTRGHILETT